MGIIRPIKRGRNILVWKMNDKSAFSVHYEDILYFLLIKMNFADIFKLLRGNSNSLVDEKSTNSVVCRELNQLAEDVFGLILSSTLRYILNIMSFLDWRYSTILPCKRER